MALCRTVRVYACRPLDSPASGSDAIRPVSGSAWLCWLSAAFRLRPGCQETRYLHGPQRWNSDASGVQLASTDRAAIMPRMQSEPSPTQSIGVDVTSEGAKSKVRAQFGPVSDAYASSEVHARGESLARLVDEIRPEATWLVLDVATGAGHTALTFAPHVARVVALDLTGQMLVKTRQLAAQRGLEGVHTTAGDGEVLPFAAGSFDLVTCRLALHHFPGPQRAIRECARVLRPGGVFGLTDNFTVDDAGSARFYNAYERLRDPSHQWVCPLDELQAMLEAAGLRVAASVRLTKEFEFNAWADRQRVPPEGKVQLLAMMRALPPPLQPLFAPRWSDGTLYFSLWEAVLVARRHSGEASEAEAPRR
jgi:ubiquinone/menaquinone biosynthesis C-methylase UbiE